MIYNSQWAKSLKIQSEGDTFLVNLALKIQCHVVKNTNLALKIQCHVVKNTLLQTSFSAIFPTGLEISV